jgi:hypothetical protein
VPISIVFYTLHRFLAADTVIEQVALYSCYTDFVSRNVTIRISDEAALWARRRAAEENTSVSRLVGEMLERQMRLTDEYWRAFDRWKSNRPMAATGAAERLSREEVHERR